MNKPKRLAGHAALRIEVSSESIADILYRALTPETESVPSDRASVNVSTSGSAIIVEIQAGDLTALRASMNSYLSWISGSLRVVDSIQESQLN
jgi:KEOPS complex subunit Pcc1